VPDDGDPPPLAFATILPGTIDTPNPDDLPGELRTRATHGFRAIVRQPDPWHGVHSGWIAAAPHAQDRYDYAVRYARGAVYAVSLELRYALPELGDADIDVRRGARPWLRRDLVIGDPPFDEAFIVGSTTPDLLSIWLDPGVRDALARTGDDATNPRQCRLRISDGTATVSAALRLTDTAEAERVIGVLDAIRAARDHTVARWIALADAIGGALEGPAWPFADDAQLRVLRARGEATLLWRRGPVGKRFVTLVMVELAESPPATPPETREALARIRAAVAELDDRIAVSMPGLVDDPRRIDAAIDLALDVAAREIPADGPYR
jgi:hypothetical protein